MNPSPPLMLLAQLSDPHVRAPGNPFAGRLDTGAYLDRAVDRLLSLRPSPDLVLVTGDLVDDGAPAAYARCRQALDRLPWPTFLVPGNHDDRTSLRAAFPRHEYFAPPPAPLHWVRDEFPLRLIGLDTSIPGAVGGRLGPGLEWLGARLAEAPARPTLVAMHHPPFSTGIGFMDRIALEDAAEFETIIRRHPQVQAVVCGHVHRHVATRLGQSVGLIAPATAHQIALALEPGAPELWTLEPPGFLLHRWDGGRLVSHAVPVDDFPGPFRFG